MPLSLDKNKDRQILWLTKFQAPESSSGLLLLGPCKSSFSKNPAKSVKQEAFTVGSHPWYLITPFDV